MATVTSTHVAATTNATKAAKAATTACNSMLQPTAMQSLTVVRNVLGATIGSITYLRNVFPEHNFKDTRLNGLQLKTLVPKQTPQADLLIDWIDRGCCDALDRQYLRTMVFGIYVNEASPEELAEAYTFSFSYPDKDRWCIAVSKDGKEEFRFKTRQDVTRATCEMLRHLLVLTQTMAPLPENAFLTMKLYYYDHVTPSDYEPPMFRAGVDSPLQIAGNKPLEISLGHVASPYHSLCLKVHTASTPPFSKDDNDNCDESVISAAEGLSSPNADIDEEKSSGDTHVAKVVAQIGQMDLQSSAHDGALAPASSQVHEENQQTTQDLINALRVGAAPAAESAQPGHVNRRIPTQSGGGHLVQQSCHAVGFLNQDMATLVGDAQADTQPLSPAQVYPIRRSPIIPPLCEPMSPNASVASSRKSTSPHGDIGCNPISLLATIRCPCGVNEHEPDLVQCRWCKLSSHAICLGLLPSSKYSAVHTCHECTRNRHGETAESILQKALLRRALFRIWDQDCVESILELANTIHVDASVAKQVSEWLEKLGILIQVIHSPGKKTLRSCPQRFTVMRSPATFAEYTRLFPSATKAATTTKHPVQRTYQHHCLANPKRHSPSATVEVIHPSRVCEGGVSPKETHPVSTSPTADICTKGPKSLKQCPSEKTTLNYPQKRRKVSVVAHDICIF
ncbi:hypothetical protein BASA83_000144 [Batrachochytrium salamandrivorans]|nr:hypothetical protein BASA83_000144 [Batrachochytrium salamandrivorans]